MQVQIKQLRDGAKMPERGHGVDVGMDVYTPSSGVLRPGPNKIALGFAISVPVGYCADIRPRSGMASGEKTLDFDVVTPSRMGVPDEGVKVKDVAPQGIGILATHPPIDPGYTGEVHAIVINTSNVAIKYPQHTRFGQLVFAPIVYATLVEAVDLTRGDNGFGSTGA